MKKSGIPLIGKRGLIGAILFAWGAFGFITAHSTANLLVNTPVGPDVGINARVSMYYDSLANDLGYKSAEDYLTAKYRKEGAGEMLAGALLTVWGFMVYGRRKLAGANTQTPQTDKPSVADVVSEIKQSVRAIDPKAMVQGVVNESRVSNPLVKTLLVWFCRIFGLLGCVASIGMLVNAMSGKASQDDAGAGGSIAMFLVFAGLTACGFWKRKKKTA